MIKFLKSTRNLYRYYRESNEKEYYGIPRTLPGSFRGDSLDSHLRCESARWKLCERFCDSGREHLLAARGCRVVTNLLLGGWFALPGESEADLSENRKGGIGDVD